MSEPTQQILIVEIKTVDSASFDTGQLNSMVVYQDSSDNYFVSTGIERITRAINEAIPCLGSNYRHPLLFNVQVIPGDEIEASLASVKDSKGRFRRSRRRKKR